MTILEITAPLRFGRFLLEPSRRLLCLDGEAVTLSSRGFDLLVLLIENRDRVVSKDEIFASVWRGVAVEDNNLAVQMSALRRALADPAGAPQTILTVPGRGYRFVAPVADVEADLPPVVARALPAVPTAAAGVAPGRRVAWPVVGAALVALPLAVWLALGLFRQPVAPRLSIVVLPFRNLSADPQQDYLADAISDDLTTDLSHIPGSVVIARESADVYKGRAVGAEVIGRALHVRYLLEGSLMPEGQVLHVNAQLIDADNGAHLWASRFDVTRDTLGRAQTSIVAQIATALKFTLVQVEAGRSLHDRPNDPDAVDLFLRAQSLLFKGGSITTLTNAQSLLERAIEIEPDFSDALARLGILLTDKIGKFDDPDEVRDHREAKDLIVRAVALAPQHPLPIISAGLLAWLDNDCHRAVPSLEKALVLEPDNMIAKDGLAHCARDLGDMQQVIVQIQSIFTIDPQDPENAPREEMLGMAYLMLGQPEKAVIWLDKSAAGLLEADGHAPSLGWQEWRRVFLIAALQESGNHGRARLEYDTYRALWPDRTVWELGTYESRPVSELPGHRVFLNSLHDAGMPYFRSPETTGRLGPPNTTRSGADFQLTPTEIPGVHVIDTPEAYRLIAVSPPPFVLDCGKGEAVIAKATWLWSSGSDDEGGLLQKSGVLAAASQGRTIIVMSDDAAEWSSYKVVIRLQSLGIRNVLWYRGGEEDWVASGYSSEDRRPR